jgi:hypothetical protein
MIFFECYLNNNVRFGVKAQAHEFRDDARRRRDRRHATGCVSPTRSATRDRLRSLLPLLALLPAVAAARRSTRARVAQPSSICM